MITHQIRRLFFFIALFVLQLNISYATNSYVDNFDTGNGGSTSLNGNDGTLAWSDSWNANNNEGGVWVTKMSGWCASGYCLRLLATNSNTQVISERRANLSGVTSATVSFDYKAYMGSGSAKVEISSNGINYTTLGILGDGDNVSYAIPNAYLTSEFRLRFRSSGNSWTDLYVDNVKLNVENDVVEELPDSDDDSIPDNVDNCPLDVNPDQIDSDNNGVGDVCDNPEGNYADDFDAGNGAGTNKSGNDGSLSWNSNWSDNGGNGVWVTKMSGWCASGYCLRLLASSSSSQVISERRANLAGVTSATVSFDYKAYLGSGSAKVEISSNGINYTTLGILSDGDNSTYAIPTAYLTSDFRLRFRSSGNSWTDLYVDNVQLSLNGSPSNEPEDDNTEDDDASDDDTSDDETKDTDQDSDGISDSNDNCIEISNSDQLDQDSDGIGNVCDSTPNGTDQDLDGIPDSIDNCPAKSNPDQADSDEDGIGDVCDNVESNDPNYSAGCGVPSIAKKGYENIWSSGKNRRYYVVVPANYNPNNTYQIVFGYHGHYKSYENRDRGEKMRGYLKLEETNQANQTIFVYPNGLQRKWSEFGSAYNLDYGWLTGQNSDNEDFIFFDDMLDEVSNNYCVDLSRVYVTGHSWGGDMASSLSCARGNDIAATTAVGINNAHFFTGFWGEYDKYPIIQPNDCQGAVPMVTYSGARDRLQGGPSSNWWYKVNGCQRASGNAFKEKISVNGVYEDEGCDEPNVYIRYTNPSWHNWGDDHQVSIDYPKETMDFFSEHKKSQ